MYIKYLIYGLEDKLSVRHIIIDEAQDYGMFQFYILKKILESSSFTILGDLCQGIHSYRGIEDWKEVAEKIFLDEDTSLLTLEQSYRTTIEIMNAASEVIGFLKDPKLPPAKPVIRHGGPVQLKLSDSLNDIAQGIKEKLSSMKSEGFKSAAVISKTFDECLELQKQLKSLKVSSKLITGSEKEFSGGVVIIPSYLVKGLEFDMVILANVSKEVYSTSELDVKLLYIAMTRPLHRLYMYSIGEPAEMLAQLK